MTTSDLRWQQDLESRAEQHVANTCAWTFYKALPREPEYDRKAEYLWIGFICGMIALAALSFLWERIHLGSY